ncbi:MAG: hypothetical protein ACFE0P_09480 [Oceanicaulis sp.]
MKFTTLAGAAALAFGAAGAGFAQGADGPPAYGAIAFDRDAASLPVRAGGAQSLEALGCWGYATVEPTAAVDMASPGPLYIAAGSDTDLTLAVRAPDGTVSCADDEAGDVNPGVVIESGAAGRYEVWIGTFGAGEGYPPTVLNVTRDRFDTANPYIIEADPAAPAGATLSVSTGFRDDPRRLAVIAGGEARMAGLGPDCYGRTGSAPAAELNYRGRGGVPLHILLEAESDTTLAVITPSGAVFCNDDAVGLDAGVRIEAPETGRYAIFAGLLSDIAGEGEPAELSVSEIGYGGIDRRIDVAGRPVFSVHGLSQGFEPDPAVFEIEAGGPIDLAQAITADGVWCSGYGTRTPSLRLTYDGEGPLYISMESETDTTLAVNAPDGAWWCNDDGSDFPNPQVSFEPAQAGVYDIYAATFSATDEPVPATLLISEIAPPSPPAAPGLDLSLEALAATLALAPGFEPSAGRFEVQAGGPAEPLDTGGAWCSGYYTEAPSVELDWAGGQISFATEADFDTTLAVNLPNGDWMCDDDGGGNLLSYLEMNGEAGVYDIWVGSFFHDEPGPAVLVVAEPDGGR